jgi:hypothetical protein
MPCHSKGTRKASSAWPQIFIFNTFFVTIFPLGQVEESRLLEHWGVLISFLSFSKHPLDLHGGV